LKPRLSYLSCGVVVTLLSVAIVLSPSKAFSQTREQPQYDVVIVNGHIIDDTGNPWYAADLAISGDRIAAIGDLHDAHAKRRMVKILVVPAAPRMNLTSNTGS
jgi:urease alpha subunit